MRHFITQSLGDYSDVVYYYNDNYNKIGDFSSYFSTSYGEWTKHRIYRGIFVYSKEPHYENNGIKEWYYSGRWYDGYEAYILAVVG